MKSFWKNKNVLITGHTGFKGSWLTLILSQMGSVIHGIALKENEKSFFKKLEIHKCLKTNNYQDINNYIKIKKLIINIKPQIIFHLAAQPLVLESYKNPLDTFKTNVIGSANLLRSLSFLKNSPVIIVVTSDKCYLPGKKKSFKENDKLGGNDIYSASKACTEILANAFRESYFKKNQIKLATVRAGNVIGGGDFAKNRIFPDLIEAYLNNTKCLIRNPNSIRPWQHVLDPLNGYLILAKKIYESNDKIYQSEWNFGPGSKPLRVLDLINILKRIIPVKVLMKKSKNEILESAELRLNSLKAKRFLKWKQVISLKKTIQLSVDWYLNQNDKKKIKEITIDQIQNFFDK